MMKSEGFSFQRSRVTRSWRRFPTLLALIVLIAGLHVGCGDSSEGNRDAGADTNVDSASDTEAPDGDDDAADGDEAVASWTPMVEEFDRGAFLSVWGRSEDDVFVAGGTDSDGVLLHFDGDDWTDVTLPEDTPLLNWVFGIGEALWVVGDRGTVLYRPNDDSAWEQQLIGTDEPLWGIWGTSPDDMWTVGGDAPIGEITPGIVFRWNGDAWSEQIVPEGEDEIQAFFKVWGTGPDDVYVVGAVGRILHWDGEELTGQTVAPFRDLVSLWGSDEGDIYVSGGRSQAVLLEQTGLNEWSRINTGALSAPGMNGTWVAPDSTAVYSAGVTGTIIRYQPDGPVIETESVPTTRSLHGIWGASGGEIIYAVGGVLEAGNLGEGVILRRETARQRVSN